ncbi:MAG: T9SS type A sorting domain-containing protein [Ignavibacteriaceae bacterium]
MKFIRPLNSKYIIFVLLTLFTNGFGNSYYVSTTGNDITGIGSQTNPWKTISYALSSINGTAGNPHTIFIQAGIYSPTTTGEIYPLVLKSYVSLQGQGMEFTVLDGDTNNYSHRIINFEGITHVKIDGISIKHGYAPLDSISNVTLGGGIYINGSYYITISNTNICYNLADNYTGGSAIGGGLVCESSSYILLKHNIFYRNIAVADGAQAGGVYFKVSNGIFYRNIISNNFSWGLFGAGGGGLSCFGNSIIIGNTLYQNSTVSGGGGILCNGASIIVRNEITDNTVGTGFASNGGGGIYCYDKGYIGGSIGNGNNIYDNTNLDTSFFYGNQISQAFISQTPINAQHNFFGTGIDPNDPIEVYGNFEVDPYSLTHIDYDTTELIVIPSPIYFDSCFVDDTSSVNSLFCNAKISLNDSIKVYNIFLDSNHFFIDQTQFNIQPLGRFPLFIKFSADLPGEYLDTLHILSNVGEIVIEMRGVAVDTFTSVKGDGIKISSSYKLYQNYPNPFNPTTTIKYDLPQSSVILIQIFNNLGEKVKTLYSGLQSSGTHEIVFDGSSLPSGIYFYQITTKDFSQTKKCLLLK